MVPSPWKRAIILPKLKKTNLDPIFFNYRTLSNLSFISKITEKAVFIQVVNHLTLHHLFPGTQSAYRKHHSMDTALLKVTNDILLRMNRQPYLFWFFLILAQPSTPSTIPSYSTVSSLISAFAALLCLGLNLTSLIGLNSS